MRAAFGSFFPEGPSPPPQAEANVSALSANMDHRRMAASYRNAGYPGQRILFASYAQNSTRSTATTATTAKPDDRIRFVTSSQATEIRSPAIAESFATAPL